MAARPRQADDLDVVLHEAAREVLSLALEAAHLGVCEWSKDSRRATLSRSCAAPRLSLAPIDDGEDSPHRTGT